MGRTDLGDSKETSEKLPNNSSGKTDSERTESIDSETTESTCFGDVASNEDVSCDGLRFVPGDLSGRYKLQTENYNASDGQGNNVAVNSRRGSANQNVMSLEQRKNDLSLPMWFKDLVKNSNVTAIDGWTHYEIIRKDGKSKDKYFKHRDYGHAFRSKPEVLRYLATAEVKKEKIRQKIVADPSGQDPGASRPTKRNAVTPTPSNNPQGFGCYTVGDPLSREHREHGWL